MARIVRVSVAFVLMLALVLVSLTRPAIAPTLSADFETAAAPFATVTSGKQKVRADKSAADLPPIITIGSAGAVDAAAMSAQPIAAAQGDIGTVLAVRMPRPLSHAPPIRA